MQGQSTSSGKTYGSFWTKWLPIYLIAGGIVYAIVYFLFLSGGGGSGGGGY
jgi:hypothetical protein